MRVISKSFALQLSVACTALLVSCTVDPPTTQSDPTDHASQLPAEIAQVVQHPQAAVCNGGKFRCFARIRTDESGRPQTFATPQGLGADDLASAYSIDTTLEPGATIAIVGAYGYSALESDLGTYRSQYGLPACTKANGCLKIVNQTGATSPLPTGNTDWNEETSLDVDMASAACPHCKLLVLQADDDQGDGLFIANATAASMGATVITNSWGAPEGTFGTVSDTETYFNHSGVAVFVAAGDDGYNDGGQGPDYPATSAYTIGVGGTSLQPSSNSRGWVEAAWNDGGSACSQNVAKPSWQTSTACSKRMTSDVWRSAIRTPASRPIWPPLAVGR